MLCQNCKKRDATENFEAVVGGKPVALHLCAKCAFEMFGGFENAVNSGIYAGLLDEEPAREKVCPVCKLTFSSFKKSGLLGCPSCYDVFKEELLPYVNRIQGGTEHVGKSGGANTAEHDLRLKLLQLQKEMELAIARGDYKSAQIINAKLNALKKGGGR